MSIFWYSMVEALAVVAAAIFLNAAVAAASIWLLMRVLYG